MSNNWSDLLAHKLRKNTYLSYSHASSMHANKETFFAATMLWICVSAFDQLASSVQLELSSTTVDTLDHCLVLHNSGMFGDSFGKSATKTLSCFIT